MRCLVMFLTVLLAGCVTASGDRPAPADLAERFEVLAFYDEDGSSHPLQRWDLPLHVSLVGDVEGFRPYAKFAERHIADLATLTGLPYAFKPGGMTLVFGPHETWRQVLRGASAANRRVAIDCEAHIFGRGNTPTRGVALIRNDLPSDRVRNCIVQETTQILGLRNDIADPDGTIFASGGHRTSLSETDRKLLRILYDPRLRSGMTRQQAMPIVRQIIAENGW